MQPALFSDPTAQHLEQILNPAHTLRKDDIIWVLEYIKKKVADEKLHLIELSQPQLLKSYCYFAEVAMMLIHQRHPNHETDRLQKLIREAVEALKPPTPN
jgi:hypothetical protein